VRDHRASVAIEAWPGPGWYPLSHGHHLPDRRDRVAPGRAAAGGNARGPDGRTRVDGHRVGRRGGNHAADSQQPPGAADRGAAAARRPAGAAPLSPPGHRRGRADVGGRDAARGDPARGPNSAARGRAARRRTAPRAHVLRPSRRPARGGPRGGAAGDGRHRARRGRRCGDRARDRVPAAHRYRPHRRRQAGRAVLETRVPTVSRLERTPLSHRRQARRALCRHWLAQCWVRRLEDTRALEITATGRIVLREVFKIERLA
jgi:hypothetical protein